MPRCRRDTKEAVPYPGARSRRFFGIGAIRRYNEYAMNGWLDEVRGLVELLRTSPEEPITFLIGAGASLSSGAPSTADVEAALKAVNGGDLPETELTEIEKRTVVRLFDRFEPYLGYNALAAMARTRPVYVLNLNWDDGVERAAAAAGVERTLSIDIDEETRLSRLDKTLQRGERRNGIVCIHLHGLLPGGNYRFSRLATLKFEGVARSVILQLLRHTTVIIGASLRADYDMTEILRDAAGDGHAGPVWFFSREERSQKQDYALMGILAARGQKQVIQHAGVDFDRLLLHIHTASGDLPYDDFVSRYWPAPKVPKAPKYADLVFPRPEVIRPLLQKRAIAIVEDPKVGKSAVGLLLTFFFKTCDKRCVNEEVMATRDVWSCTSFLNNHDGILYLDRPFGTDDFRSNPQFFGVLSAKLRRTKKPATRVIIECTPTAWQQALAEHGQDVSEFVGCTPLDIPWFSREDLLALFDPQAHPAIAQAISDDVLRTPGQVITALKTGVAFPPQAEEAIAEKKRHMALLGDYAKVVALVRLQHLGVPRPWRNLLLDAGFRDHAEVLNQCSRWIEIFQISEHRFAHLSNPSDAKIIDELLDVPGSALLAAVNQVGAHNEWVIDALRARDAVRAVREKDAAAVATIRREDLRDLAPVLLKDAGDDWPLEFIEHQSMDLCVLRDLAFEIVRLWPNLSGSIHSERIFRELLKTESREGLYALIEAALFLKDATEPEIFERFSEPLWELLKYLKSGRAMPEERLRLIAMIVDGLLWRDSSRDDSFATRWFHRFFHAVPETSELAGAFAFSLVYHGQAAAKYLHESQGQQQRLQRLNRLADHPEQADWFCWMMRWHFERECRDRAIMLRRDQLPKNFLKYIGRTADGEVAPPEEIPILLAALRALKTRRHAGWAFHLALNMATVNGRYNAEVDDEVSQLFDLVPDADAGVLLAVTNYPAECVLDKLQEYFRRPVNRNALLDAFARGIHCNTHLDAPRFDYTRDPFEVMTALDIRWPALERVGAVMDREQFFDWINDLAARAHVPPHAEGEVRRLLKLAARGDLRPFDDAARKLLDTMSPELVAERLIETVAGIPSPAPRIPIAPQPHKDEDIPDSIWISRLDEVIAGKPAFDPAPFLSGFISAAKSSALQRRLADAYRERARLRVFRNSNNAEERALVKADFREAIRLYSRDRAANEAAKTEAELRQHIWHSEIRPGQRRPSPAVRERIDKHSIEVLERTIAQHAKLSARANATTPPPPAGTRLKKNASAVNDALWNDALRDATRERMLFE